MNAARRHKLAKAQELYEQGCNLINQAREIVTECRDEEQEYLDNMPESLQNSEKGENAQAAIEAMEGLIDSDEPEPVDWDTWSTMSI